MLKYFLLLLTFATFNVFGNAINNTCSVELFHKVYRSYKNQVLGTKDIIKDSNCSEEINSKISLLLSQAEGAVGVDFINSEMQKEFPLLSINIKTKKLTFLDLNDNLKEQLLQGTNLFFTQSKSMNGLSTIGLVEGEQLRVSCETCNNYGDKNVKLEIVNTLNGNQRTLWMNSRIMAKIKVLKAKNAISFQQKSLQVDDFYFDEILTMHPEHVLTTLENIQFHKPNKTIVENAVVLNQDIQPLMLVNYGTPVTLLLNNQNISLQKSALPLRSARFGEIVELKSTNNKSIIGKVIDFNKVVIQL